LDTKIIAMIKIYHNPRCGKSRDCLAFIQNSKQEYEVIKYLETPLSFNELEDIIRKLNIKPIELIRKNETIWIEKYKNKDLSDIEIIQSMVDSPILIERPIVINGSMAVIVRPLEKLTSLFNDNLFFHKPL